MAGLANVVRRAGVYHFRRVVPVPLRQRLQRRELVRSLETSSFRSAKLRAGLLYLASDRLLAAASLMLSQDLLARLVRDFYDLVLSIDDHRRLLDEPLSEEDHAWQVAFLDEALDRHKRALALNRFDGLELATTVVMARNGIVREQLKPGEHNQIRQAILRAGIDVTRELRARSEGEFDYKPRDPLLKPTTAAAATMSFVGTGQNAGSFDRAAPTAAAAEARATEPAPADVSPQHTAEPLFQEVAAAFRTEQAITKAWDAQTASQARATYRLFAEVCSDKPVAAYGRADADRFRKQVSLLPYDYSKAVQYRGLTVAQILKRAEAEAATCEVTRLNQRTVKRHFSALSALWASALAAGTVKENIFAGFRFAAAKRTKDQRPMWAGEELKALFSSPVWTGCKSDVRRTEPGALVLRDEYYWIPLIGVFSGMRQEEICQLHLADIREGDGITYFDLNDRPPRQLKNATAIRKVPVHKELVRLGLIEHVEACRRAGETMLFPNLIRGGADGRLGHAFSKWFTRYRQEIGIYRRGLDFHALRHTASTLMHQAGVDGMVLDHLTGHTTPGETSRYTKGSTLKQLQSAIDRIDLGFDLTSFAPPDVLPVFPPVITRVRVDHRAHLGRLQQAVWLASVRRCRRAAERGCSRRASGPAPTGHAPARRAGDLSSPSKLVEFD
jgi:integrase